MKPTKSAKSKSMTPKMKQLLASFADGADPNIYFQLEQLMGRRRASIAGKTMLALYDRGYLHRVPDRGLQISDAGMAAAKTAKTNEDV